jgi:DNA-binding MarR family transcriptional regulator
MEAEEVMMKLAKMQGDSDNQFVLFGNLFLLANKLQVVSDQYLEKDDYTTKQWFLVAAINQFSDTPPTLSEVSELIGCSRQNVKQMAIKLETKGLLKIVRDEQDTRSYRLVLTDKCHSFWQKREIQDSRFIVNIMSCLDEQEAKQLSIYVDKILKRIAEVRN